MPPQPSPATSFLRFAFGFFLFISLSFGITYAVNSYTFAQAHEQQAAAADAALFGTEK